jgi:hypothetical protein
MKDQPPIVLDFSNENDEALQKRNTVLRRITLFCLRFSCPKLNQFNSSLESQERLRRSHIMSVLHILILVAVGLFFPLALIVPSIWVPLTTLVLFGSASFFCNRTGSVMASSIIYILGVDAALTILLVTLPHGLLRNSNVPDFDLFLIATLAGGIVLPRRFLPFLVIFHLSLIILLFTFVPHDPLLTQEITAHGEGSYGVVSDAIVLQIIGASIAWLNSWSVDKALFRASKAEDLAKVHQRLNEYMQLQVAQRTNLEYGIQVLKEAHARFANGDYKARAVLQNNELASLALSFNLLAERLNRIASIALDYSRLEQAFQQLFTIRDTILHRGILPSFNSTGTYVDQVYPWMMQFYQSRQLFFQYGKVTEKVRLALVRQQTLIVQLKSAIGQTYADAHVLIQETKIRSSTFEGVEKSQQLCLQAEEQGKCCLQEMRQLEQQLKASS